MLIYLLPFIAAITGWLTNMIAVKMLFHPRKKIKLGFFSIQGIFPKRQEALAEKLGNLVSNELFSVNDLKEIIKNPEMLSGVNKKIEQRIDGFIVNFSKSNPMLGMFLTGGIKDKIKQTLLTELEAVMPEITEEFANKLEDKIDVKSIVKQKVSNFSSNEIEKMLYAIMSKEFRFIEILGGILGFIIGLLQLIIVMIN